MPPAESGIGCSACHEPQRAAWCTCQEKAETKKEYLSEAPFGLELNGAFVAQGSGRAVVIKKVHISVEKCWSIMGVGQIKFKIGNPTVGFCEVQMDVPVAHQGLNAFRNLRIVLCL